MKFKINLAAAMMVIMVACTPLDVIKTIMPSSPGISAQVGKEANKQIVGEQNKIEVDAETSNITQKENDNSVTGNVEKFVVNNVQAVPLWVWIITILGWMLPTPTRMFNYLVSRVRQRKS